MGLEGQIAALISALLISIGPAPISKNPGIILEATPLAQRGFKPYREEHAARRTSEETVVESTFYYNIKRNIVIENVRDGKVVDAFICSLWSRLSYYSNTGSKEFEDMSPEPNPACNQKDFAKPAQ
ncbi:hypothetical protein HYX07_04565 [Candidatus Woesearchaeota archaeon]|nr:hypothetical protein [Candidatus Woesearchaeota archaeon]